ERDSLKEKLNQVAQVEFKRMKEDLGAPDRIETVEELRLFEASKKEAVGVKSGGGSVGRSSLNSDGTQSDNQTFSNRKDLIENIPEETKTQLWEKTIQGIKEKGGKLQMDMIEAEKAFENEGIYRKEKDKLLK
ncbi:MAG: hypothetical protein NWF06_02055, partial [Candidatus Bathyarchaeota archaeon]|nr:hypothetical protein [Candidatus Bathyarchaeum sp.]